MTTTISAEALRSLREGWSGGSDQRYRHPLHRRFIYTAGVQNMAERAACYWLLDIIATECLPIALKQLEEHENTLTFLKVIVVNRIATLALIHDSEGPVFWTRRIEGADLPDGEWPIWLGADGFIDPDQDVIVAMLPEEY